MANPLLHLPICRSLLFLIAACAVGLPPLEKANAVPEHEVPTTLDKMPTLERNDITPSDCHSSKLQPREEVETLILFDFSYLPLKKTRSTSKPALAAGGNISAQEPLSEIFLPPAQVITVTPDAKPAALRKKPRSSIDQLFAQITAAQAPQPDETPPNFGETGQKYWYVQGAGAVSFDDEDFDGEDETAVFGLTGVGISQFFATGHSINVELNTLGFIQPNKDALGLNLAVLWRWHFYRQPDWSLYLDGGAGVLATTSEVPSFGSSFNFTPQLGGGVTFRLGGGEQLMVGLRWYHISNADLYDSNPGRDSIMLYGGWIIPR